MVIRLLAKSRSTCQCPDVASLSVLYLELANSGSMSSFWSAIDSFLLPCLGLLGQDIVLNCHLVSLLVL